MAMTATAQGIPLSKRFNPWPGLTVATLLLTAAGGVAVYHHIPRHPVAAVLRHLGMNMPPAPQRADIVDRRGVLLARSVMVKSLYADPSQIADPHAAAAALSAVLPGLNTDTLATRLLAPRRFVWIARQITPAQMQSVNALSLPGLGYRYEERRQYPMGAQTVHVLGYANVDHAGIAGVELAAEKQLSTSHAPLRLTLDAQLQATVHDQVQSAMVAAGAAEAAAVIMDARTGEIAALVSLPDFDPGQGIQGNQSNQRFDRATQAMIELDDFYGPFREALALERGELADNALPAGVEQEFMRRLGFLGRSSLIFPEQALPLLPDTEDAPADYQHGLAVTGIQLATAYSALVNGGTLPSPTLIERAESMWVPQVISEKTSAALRGQFKGGVSSVLEKPRHYGVAASALAGFPADHPRYVVFATLGTVDYSNPDKETLRGLVTHLADQLASHVE